MTRGILITGKSNNSLSENRAAKGFSVSGEIPGESGFSLVELIVVLALIAIMLVLGVPAFRENILDSSLNAAARKTIGFVRGVRELAAREKKPYYLYVDMIEHRLWFMEDEGKKTKKAPVMPKIEKATSQNKLVFPDGVRIFEIQTGTFEKFSGGERKIWISPRGYMERTAFHLEGKDQKVISLYFQPFLEHVKIYEKYTPFL